MQLTYSQIELPKIAAILLEKIPSKIWLFYGTMGSGKTTLIKALVKLLSLADVANSPTFSIVNEYQSRKGTPIYHFDFYRIKKEEEALDLGIDDYFYSDNYCFVEWPEKIENLLPLNAVSIYIVENADGSRTLTLKN
ncbi:MAG: tRNA (adenosine(37)-N6)-threonylcarbamoyltransferase complex ATPase subunit type 1 TsaE [Flavobacteriales bacterium CG_4_9_14_0_2_um_filter_35_242]|nr:MAG: tRNA (adenosine(37)-N6)-threonylcarbamoyltransferase complex ATPase subunit type 1 TsaE [Flavobacteriales bacterium CG11_big_fil_rev_8_21_14_0_20_35_7]PJA05554.1 MAG: tRNA (adenosine(37)-N6)-threonylcarbamoyltransferase complex ATPase subunit type 1 TsaE [Flavobacteriales bacterium CG_4_10_14_0_2_um_filter_35_18]PJC58926.1 MAG: tRNA (adenosine(37)-N6)-threonylcarbamoyltransferase complex ATPase subunit type 1 TsaE [Flavobacteriales bacterium CG_4_9_14_0_2_um_filter_35_242]